MSDDKIKSKAFQHAALSSESYRILWLIYILCALLLLVIVRSATANRYGLMYVQTVVLALGIAYEVSALMAVKKALRRDTAVAPALWVVNILIEAAFPTIALFVLIESQFTPPYEALVAPAVFLYFLFIIL